MADSQEISEKLSWRYGIEVLPNTIDHANYEQRQTLGQLFLKSEILRKLRQEYDTYIKVRTRAVDINNHPHLEIVENVLTKQIDSQALDQIWDLIKALGLHGQNSTFSKDQILDSVKDKSLKYLEQKLELERVVATKQRILLMIAEKQQMIEKLTQVFTEKDGRSMGDLREKELLQALESVSKYREKLKITKQQTGKIGFSISLTNIIYR